MKKDARTRNSSFRAERAGRSEDLWDSRGNKVTGHTMEDILAELRKMNEKKEPNTSFIPGRKTVSLDIRNLHNSGNLNMIAANVFATNIESGRDGDRNDITNLESPHDDSYIDPRDMTGRGLMKSSRVDYEENNDDEYVFKEIKFKNQVLLGSEGATFASPDRT
jgi:hypothetical protein